VSGKGKMKTSKGHHFTIRPRDPTQIMQGANVEVYMDGHKLGGVSSFKLDIQPRELAKITLEFWGTVDVDGNFEAVDPVLRTLGQSNGVLGQFSPVGGPPKPFIEAPPEVDTDDPDYGF